jgi:hypothetical protein
LFLYLQYLITAQLVNMPAWLHEDSAELHAFRTVRVAMYTLQIAWMILCTDQVEETPEHRKAHLSHEIVAAAACGFVSLVLELVLVPLNDIQAAHEIQKKRAEHTGQPIHHEKYIDVA